MKIKNIFLYIWFCLLMTAVSPAYAFKLPIPVFFSWGGERIIKVADFPNTDTFKTRGGQHVDPGYRYKQITLIFTPLWNYDGQWCGYVDDSGRYLEIDKTKLDAAATAAGISLPVTPSLPFWEAYGGKLLWLVVIVVIAVVGKSGSKNDVNSKPTEFKAGE
ncbi:MAG: hypothetical protein NTY05_03910 [Rhodocyclales bacterium]|nr:hypothetical protein [Rhodocyclales bacterium]